MTQTQMMQKVRSYGFGVSVRDGEIRITDPSDPTFEYFTDDRQDAVDTALVAKTSRPPTMVYHMDSPQTGEHTITFGWEMFANRPCLTYRIDDQPEPWFVCLPTQAGLVQELILNNISTVNPKRPPFFPELSEAITAFMNL